jgi:hypothetical protein
MLALSMLLLLVTGCGGAGSVEITRTVRDYQMEDYKSASRRCAGMRKKEPSMNAKTQLNYRMYCGLVYWRTGKRGSAYRYLKVADEFYKQGDPSWISPQAVAEMKGAITQLEGAANEKDDAEDEPAPPATDD